MTRQFDYCLNASWTILDVASMVVTWWIVTFCAVQVLVLKLILGLLSSVPVLVCV